MTPAQFLTIKEAAAKYHRSEITVRRFVRTVLESRSEEKRKKIRPSMSEAERLKKGGRPFAYTIRTDLLTSAFPAQVEKAAEQGSGSELLKPSEYVALLERTNAGFLEQLRVKDQQIGALNTSLNELSERQRETNILMKVMQERLLLPAPQSNQTGQGKAQKKRRWWKMW